nr:MAG TPA: hypothetical protein [Bacteriophage sp.]
MNAVRTVNQALISKPHLNTLAHNPIPITTSDS